MTTLPHLSEEGLTAELLAWRERWARHGDAPAGGLDGAPAEAPGRHRFVVCGSVCRSEIRVLARHAEVAAIVDDVLAPTTDALDGIPVVDTDAWVDLARRDPRLVSCILAPNGRAFQHFTKVATRWGLRTLEPLPFLRMLEAAGVDRRGETGRFFWYGLSFFDETVARLDRLLEIGRGLDDRYSRLSWLCVLAYRLTLNPFHLEACAVGHHHDRFGLDSYAVNRGFFTFSDDEVYVDGGAYDGDTIASFLRAVQGRYRRIHAFEPSDAQQARIRERLGADAPGGLDHRIHLHPAGLWDRDAVLLFQPGVTVDARGADTSVQTLSAHLADAGLVSHVHDRASEPIAPIEVPVTRIDTATGEDASFVKLEIEGSELQALRGATGTIARCRPKLAISIYHKPEDLETLTDFVSATGQGYRLGFRQHNPLVPDAMVLYCR